MSETKLEGSLKNVVETFLRYAKQDGGFYFLTQKELIDLIKKEFPNWLKIKWDTPAIVVFFRRLDRDKDQKIAFGEFLAVISQLIVAIHDHLHQEWHAAASDTKS